MEIKNGEKIRRFILLFDYILLSFFLFFLSSRISVIILAYINIFAVIISFIIFYWIGRIIHQGEIFIFKSKHREKPTKVFKVNDIVELKLIRNKTYIYIKGKKFIQCMYLLLNIPKDKIEEYDDYKNIDEIAEQLDNSLETPHNIRTPLDNYIDPETEFMGHCSNIQAFFENGLNTNILHSNIAFPLLKELVDAKYKPAYFKFREEIVRRYIEGNNSVRTYLLLEGYLKYLTAEEEKECLNSDRYIYLEIG